MGFINAGRRYAKRAGRYYSNNPGKILQHAQMLQSGARKLKQSSLFDYKSKPRSTRSKAAVKVFRKGNTTIGGSTGTNFSSSNGVIVLNRKKPKTAKDYFKYSEQYQQICEGNTGVQNVVNGKYTLTVEQLVGATDAGSRTNLNNFGVTVFSQDPKQYISGGSHTNNPVDPADNALYWMRTKQMVELMNLTSVPTEVYCLWCVPKRDTELTPQEWWDDCMSAHILSGATNATTTTTTDTTGTRSTVLAGAPVQYSNGWGNWPTQNKGFKRLWNIKYVKKFTLESGATQKFTMKMKIYKKVYENLIKELQTQGVSFIKGCSIVPMFIIRGSPVLIKDDQLEEMSTAFTKVGMIYRNIHTFARPKEGTMAPSIMAKYGIVQLGTHTEKFINQGDSAATVGIATG